MTPSVFIYNTILAATDVWALSFVRGKRTAGSGFLAAAATGMVAAVIAFPLAGDVFGLANLAAYALFLHGTILLLGAAWLLWHARRKLAIACAVAAFGLIGVLVDATLIEPVWLEVSHVEIATTKIARRLRIVILADLQTDQIGEYEKGVLRQAVAERPDLLLFAGDYLQAEPARETELRRQLNEILRGLYLPSGIGMFAIQGNMDWGDWPAIFSGLPVKVIDQTKSFHLADIQLTCLSLADSGDPTLQVTPSEPGRFHLVLGHRPDFARGNIGADLLVAGHTHGGQVRLPGIGPLLTLSTVPRRWAAGLTELPGGRKLLVSRGIGMERGNAPRLRFLCRPELVVLDLVPAM